MALGAILAGDSTLLLHHAALQVIKFWTLGTVQVIYGGHTQIGCVSRLGSSTHVRMGCLARLQCGTSQSGGMHQEPDLARRWGRLGRSSGRLRGDALDRRIVNADPERLLRRMREQRRALAGRAGPQVHRGSLGNPKSCILGSPQDTLTATDAARQASWGLSLE